MTKIILKSTIDVTYRDHMGNDERLVEAMLVSTKGLSAEEASKEKVRCGALMEGWPRDPRRDA